MKPEVLKLLQRLLWEGKSRWLMAGALLGSFFGLLLLLLSLQWYHDIKTILTGKAESDQQFVLINKRVSLFNTLGVSAAFTNEEIDQLKQQPFIKSVGPFTPNQFKVSASSSLLGFYTELFFESVPKEYIDLETTDFTWQRGNREVPILLSRDYLALYNFGFAPSQGLPQFTPSTIRRVSFDLTLRGNNLQEVFQGRIVGFSDRINSILVPQEFMDWANKTFGGREQAKPSRLILAVDEGASRQLETYLEAQHFELSRGRFIGSKLARALWATLGLVAFIGGVMLLLSLLVFLLNFQLFIAQSSADIRLLLQLGYPVLEIRKVLHRRLLAFYSVVLIAVMLFLGGSRQLISNRLAREGFDLGSGLHWSVWLLAIAVSAALLFLNYRNIRREVERLFI